MKLSQKPKIIFIDDPEYGNKPYPYVFGCMHDTLKAMDLQVKHLNINTVTFDEFRDTINEFKPELLFAFVQDRRQVIKISNFLKDYHPVPAINWYQEDPNGVVGDERAPNAIDASENFDMWFTIDRNMLPFWKTKAYFLSPGFDEYVYDNQNLERCFDVSYIGQFGSKHVTKMYWPYMKAAAEFRKKSLFCTERPMGIPRLPKHLERILRSRKHRDFFQKLPIWPCAWGNPKNENEKAKVINQSKIHFGLNRVRGVWEQGIKKMLPEYPLDHHGLFYQLKSRPFQGVATGAMVINEYCPELEELFEIGKEIVTFEYGEVEDFREKLHWYINHDSEREKIAKAGYLRGRKEHTLSARINKIFDCVRKDL